MNEEMELHPDAQEALREIEIALEEYRDLTKAALRREGYLSGDALFATLEREEKAPGFFLESALAFQGMKATVLERAKADGNTEEQAHNIWRTAVIQEPSFWIEEAEKQATIADMESQFTGYTISPEANQS